MSRRKHKKPFIEFDYINGTCHVNTKPHPILKFILILIFIIQIGCSIASNFQTPQTNHITHSEYTNKVEDLTYSGKPYVTVNNNHPSFTKDELKKAKNSFETYSKLDELGRCGNAMASVNKDIMPTEERGEIGSVKPTGWHTIKYDWIDGKYLYNRCHLIGYQLTGENANPKNLITGTRYLNIDGMLKFENLIADYVNETNNHVLYRVTPIFKDQNLVANGVVMEAESVEDNGVGLSFHIYAFNVQPGVDIDYKTGFSTKSKSK